MSNLNQINVLGNILETTWGKSSDEYGCTARFESNILRITYSTVVYLASERSMNSQIPRVALEANERVKARLDSLKKEYKDIMGEALTLKEISNNDKVDLVQASSVNPRRVAMFRKFVDLEIG